MRASFSTLPPGTAVGGYVVEHLIDRGGMGDVYLAHDPVEHRRVALKLLPAGASNDPRRQQRLQLEGRIAQALRHANICTVYEVGEDAGRVFLAMEYIEGRSLHAITTGQSLDVERIIDIASQIAAALEEARQHHIVHRDLKGGNILITSTGTVKVLDFGIARRTTPDELRVVGAMPRQTDPGTAAGTREFMSPEQAMGRPIDHRSDLFSLGVILYELLTGRLPFAGATEMDLFRSLLNAQPEAISSINPDAPQGLIAIVEKLLEKDASARYQTAKEVVADLRTAARVRRKRGPVRRGRWAPRLLGTAAGLLLSVCGIYPGVFVACHAAETMWHASSDRPSSVWMGRGSADDLRLVVPAGADPSSIWVGNDGRVFYITRGQTSGSALWTVAPGGHEASLVARNADEVAVTRDGRAAYFAAEGGRGLYRSALDGTPAELVVDGPVSHPIATRDGQAIMFVRERAGAYAVWAAPVRSRPAFQVSPLLTPSPPRIAPNGRRIAFQTREGVVACDLPDCARRVILPIEGLLGWTPDSESLAHVGPPDSANVWLIKASSGSMRQLTHFTDRAVSGIAWSPNGERFAVTRTATFADSTLFRFFR